MITLTAADEYMCHQMVASFDEVINTDRNWTEKSYIVAFDQTYQVMIAIGMGKYTNRNVMDAFACVAVPGRVHNVRASRELRPEWDEIKVGPIDWQIIQPPKKNRVILGENDQGITFDILFESDYQPVVGNVGVRRNNGITSNQTIRYFQPGRASGSVTVAGKTYHIAKETSYAYKDRSWGVRTMTGIPNEGAFHFNESSAFPEAGLQPTPHHAGGILHGYLNLQFKDWAISTTFTQGPDGNAIPSATGSTEGFVVFHDGSGRAPIPIVERRLAFEFFPGTRRGKSLQAEFILADGSSRKVSCQWRDLVWYFRAGGYFGFRGWWQGKYMGPYAIAGETLDLTDKATRDELYGCEEIAVECQCDGETGHGVLEPWAIGALPGYGIKEEDLG